ncbi:MAG: hypothetical protein WC229_03515 [Candidatus Paceibacterota bacterium]|jgi:hypothetical protein
MILDYIDNIIIDVKSPPVDNLHAIKYLQDGIIFLANYTKQLEDSVMAKKLNPEFYKDFSGAESNLLANIYNWFAVSIISYLRSIATLDYMGKNNVSINNLSNFKGELKEYTCEYIKKVVPEIYEWRNKVGGHFAITDPKDDSPSTLEASFFNNISFEKGRSYAGSLKWGESKLPKWSLVKEFEEKLVPRYWPNITCGDDGDKK